MSSLARLIAKFKRAFYTEPMRKLGGFFLFLLFLIPIVAADVSAGFRPAWWSLGAHPQTIWGFLLRPVPEVPIRRERLETPDGDFFDVDWLPGEAGTPVVILVHGL